MSLGNYTQFLFCCYKKIDVGNTWWYISRWSYWIKKLKNVQFNGLLTTCRKHIRDFKNVAYLSLENSTAVWASWLPRTGRILCNDRVPDILHGQGDISRFFVSPCHSFRLCLDNPCDQYLVKNWRPCKEIELLK